MSLVQLELTRALAGEAQGRDAPWHYVVATDVLPQCEADFNAWYDTEHLAGLAAVPGVARATRYRLVQGAGPLYHAGYDLAERDAFNSPAWLAVRGTPWSSRVRPSGLPGRTRTCDPQLRRLVLYPVELRAVRRDSRDRAGPTPQRPQSSLMLAALMMRA
jgi:hypothetical protein